MQSWWSPAFFCARPLAPGTSSFGGLLFESLLRASLAVPKFRKFSFREPFLPATKISEISVALGNLAVVKFRKFWLLERDTLPVIEFPKLSVGMLAIKKFPKFLRYARGSRGNKISEF